ncbi:hypothetical protein [Sideroxyarcus sp. TK5]
MKRKPPVHPVDGRISIPGLLMRTGFNATLTFFCTLRIFSLD